MDNVIYITDLGLQAAHNAKEGGVHVNVVYFKIGDSSEKARETDFDIIGSTLCQGQIHLIEVLDNNTSRFTFEIPAHAVPEGGLEAREVGLYMDDNVMFGRCVFEEPYHLYEGRATRIHALLVTTRIDPSVINVTMGDLSSIPSAANVHRLPPPDGSQYNALSVLDGLDNLDGTVSPSVALKFGSGSLQWAFSGFDRVFSGTPDAGATGEEFRISSLTTSMTFRNGEVLIGYVVSGPARGQSRKLYYAKGENKFVEKDGHPIANFDESSTIVIWRRMNGGGAGSSDYPPAMSGIPEDWVLTRGVGNLPVWAPPKNTGKNLNTLYETPGKMRISAINETGTGQERRYSLGNVVLKDVNHCVTAIGGITQHKTAYDISGSELEFAENIPTHATIDIQMITKEPGSGTYVEVVTDMFVADGETRRFRISEPVESTDYVWPYIRGLKQSKSAYSYDPETQEIVFVSAPKEGQQIESSSFVMRKREGYSTKLVSTTVMTVGDTLFVELPVEPQSKDQTFVSVSGSHIHRDLYTVVDNKIVFSSAARGGLSVEVLIFHNVLSQGTPQTNLSGVVTDAVMTSKAIKLMRHGAHPIILPIPSIDLRSGPGIKITGEYPALKIENTFAQQFNATTDFKYSSLRRETDTEEIIFTHRVELTADLMVTVHVDFAAVLGPGFASPNGQELIQYVIGLRTTGSKEPEYGRDIKGTGEAGFSSLASGNNERAYSNASLTQIFDLIKSNIPAGFVDVVVRMRVRNANISSYGSKLAMNVNLMGKPKT